MRPIRDRSFGVLVSAIGVTLAACGGSAGASPTVTTSPAPSAVASASASVSAEPPASPSVAVSPSAGVAVASPAPGPRLAFAVKADGTSQIWSQLPDGGDLRQVTSGDGNHLCAALAPDGHTVAFCGDASGSFEIWTVQLDGSAQTQLTKLGGRALFPDISPDGTKIAFAGAVGDDQHTEVYVIDGATGGGLTALMSCAGAKPGCANDYPSWSPDGTQLVYIHKDDDNGDAPVNQQVWIMNADGGDAHPVTTGPNPKDQVPDWSPDGTTIAYANGPIGSEGIWLVGIDGSKARQISGCADSDAQPCAGGDDFGPAWSPDGTEIAFLRDYQAIGQDDRPVFLMKADGSDQRRLSPASTIAAVPDWR